MSSEMKAGVDWLIWSRCWNAWWRTNGGGYTDDIAQAGRFTEEYAKKIQRSRAWRSGFKPRRGYADVAIPEKKALALAATGGGRQ